MSNAAVSVTMSPVLESTDEAWDKTFDINVRATFLLMKESLPLLKCSQSPSIIIVSSISGYQPFNVSLFDEIFITIIFSQLDYI